MTKSIETLTMEVLRSQEKVISAHVACFGAHHAFMAAIRDHDTAAKALRAHPDYRKEMEPHASERP